MDAALVTKLKRQFLYGGLLTKLLYINVGVFLIVRLVGVLLLLFKLDSVSFVEYLELPSSLPLLLRRPWTLITYMFLHVDFLHIVFNMLWLYWFGRIFLQFFNDRQLGGLYVSGGIAGAILFILAYNLLPYFRNMAGGSFMLGASASVMAIVFAVSFYQKDYKINMLFIGEIKLIYLAVFTIVIDFLSIASANAGGHIAHIGGALYGILFAVQLRKGKDLTFFVNRLIDKMVNLRKGRGRRMKVSYKRPESDMEYRARKKADSDAIDAILDKLKRSGYESLSSDEKKQLFDASKK